MKPEILVLTPIYAPALAELEREFTVHKLWTANDPDTFIKEVSGRVRAMVTTGPAGFSSRHLDALPKLEIIACFGSGRAAMDLPAELIALDNVVMVPHIGSSTREVRENRTANLLANLRAHFSGKPVLTPIA